MMQQRGEVTEGIEAPEAMIAGGSGRGADGRRGGRRAASAGSEAAAGARSEGGVAAGVLRVRTQQREGVVGHNGNNANQPADEQLKGNKYPRINLFLTPPPPPPTQQRAEQQKRRRRSLRSEALEMEPGRQRRQRRKVGEGEEAAET